MCESNAECGVLLLKQSRAKSGLEHIHCFFTTSHSVQCLTPPCFDVMVNICISYTMLDCINDFIVKAMASLVGCY